jgi:nucleotide-binding universal stress UspA family protein
MIIVTTDGSERSRHAIPHAAAFAQALGMQLGLLQIIDPEEIKPGPLSWPRRLKAAIAQQEGLLSAIAAEESVEAQPLVGALHKGESTADAILRCADEQGGQMIVMDSRGHSTLRHTLLGSVTMGVLAGSEIPLMVTGPEIVPPRAADGYRIVATSDGSKASEDIFAALLPFLSRVQVDLLTVYVPRLGDAGDQAEMAACHDKLTDLQRQLPQLSQCQTIVKRAVDLELPEAIVIETARELGANALAMSTHGHSAQRHFLLGSFAAACIARSPVPVFLARQ